MKLNRKLLNKARNPSKLLRGILGPTMADLIATNLFDNRVEAEGLIRRYGFWVHRAISLNATFAASVPFGIFTHDRSLTKHRIGGRYPKLADRRVKAYLDGRDRSGLSPSLSVQKAMLGRDLHDLVEMTSHPALDLLTDINPWSEAFSWRESLFSCLQIFGQDFEHVVEDDRGLPQELWWIPTHQMKPIPDPVKFISGFEMRTSEGPVNFDVDEVLWLKTFDPGNRWGSLGPLEAWLKTIDAGFAIQAMQFWMFKQGGHPDWMIISDSGPSEPQKRAIRKEWKNLFGRLFNRKENIGFLHGSPRPELKQLSMSPKELEFQNSQKDVRDMIGQAFGVPKSKLTTDDVNRANARELDEIHLRETIWPMLRRLEDLINERLLPRFGEDLILVHKNPIPEDRTLRNAERTSQLQSGYTVNQVLSEDGQESVDDPIADTPLIASGLIPLSSVGQQQLGGGGLAGDLGFPLPESDTTSDQAALLPGGPSPQVVLQGPQITAALDIVQRVADGRMPRDAAIGQLQVLFHMTPEQAEQILGSVGAGFESEQRTPPVPPQLNGNGNGQVKLLPTTRLLERGIVPGGDDIRDPFELVRQF